MKKRLLLQTALTALLSLTATQALGINQIKDFDRPDVFFLSYNAPSVGDELKKDPLLGQAPAIGKYGQEIAPGQQQYNFLQPLVFIELQKKNASAAPNNLINAVLKQLGKPPFTNKEDAVTQLQSLVTMDVYTIVWGSPFFEKPQDRTYNLVFHPLARKWGKATGANVQNMSVKLPVGIFDPKDIKPVSIALNDLRPEDVVIHPAGQDLAYSPNNLQFALQPNAKMAGFWSAALSQDKKNLVIIYNVIVDDATIEDQLRTIVQTTNNLEDLKEELFNVTDLDSGLAVMVDLLNLLTITTVDE